MMREEQRPDGEILDRALRKSFRELEAARGACPAPAQLVKYQAGELGSEESAAIRRHVVLCGACELYVERLEEFDSAAISTAEAGPLRRDVRRALQGSRFGMFGKPALGYVVALLLAYPAYRWLFPAAAPAERRETNRRQPAVTAVRAFELPETRPASAPLARIELGPGEERFSLSFFVPGRKGGRYSVEIRDSAGATVGEAATVVPASLGGVTLLCETAAFHSGHYKLTVAEPSGATAGRQFDYSFDLRLPTR